jgi:hypothetical protein
VPGRSLGDGLAVFHDCPLLDMRQTQLDQEDARGGPPHAFAIEVGRFSGSYLSLVVDLPAPVAQGLTRKHLVSMRAQLALSGPTEVYARLNLRHGPNTDALIRKAMVGAAASGSDVTDLQVDFDLATVAIEADRMAAGWVDLIVSRPEGLRLEVRDIVLSRRLRAVL